MLKMFDQRMADTSAAGFGDNGQLCARAGKLIRHIKVSVSNEFVPAVSQHVTNIAVTAILKVQADVL